MKIKSVIKSKSHILKSLFLGLAILFVSSQKLFCQTGKIDLKKLNPDQILVLGGNVLCQPKSASYGWVCPGEGKMLYAFTEEGTILWQKMFRQKLNPFISVGLCDMIYVVTKDCFLNMLNPGGTLLWSKKCSFDIAEDPLVGKDGRVFVRGKNGIECYGINGVLRWSVKTELQNTKLPLLEFNDGSILFFLERESEGKSIARVCSPFGDVSEEIIFSSKVSSAKGTVQGVLICFADSSIGMCSIEKDGGAVSKWLVSSQNAGISIPVKFAENTENAVLSEEEFIISSNPAKITRINVKTGEILSVFQTDFPDTQSLRYSGFTKDGLVLCDKQNAACYSLSSVQKKSPEQKIVWSAALNPQKRWSYVYPSQSGYLTFCTNNWVIESYRVKQSVKSKATLSTAEKKQKNPQEYKQFYKKQKSTTSHFMGPAISTQVQQEMHKSFTQGNFGKNEVEWISLLSSEMQKLYEDWNTNNWDHSVEKPYFTQNLAYTQKILSLTYESGICIERAKLAKLIKSTTDPSILLCLVECAKTAKMDPDGSLLAALEFLLKNKSGAKDSKLILSIADATYEICRYMGRPAFFDKGQEILTFMLYPQFSDDIHEKARETLDKIIELRL